MADTVRDISYGARERNSLDLVAPEGVADPPLVVFVHGGRWFRNDRTQVELYDRVDALTSAGMAVATIDYTYSIQQAWPAQLEDLRAAFSFLRENADTYGYDADRIAVWGQSSGAHLALWAAYDQAGNPDTALDALVSWYAPSDLFNLAADRQRDDVPDRPLPDGERPPEDILINAVAAEDRQAADAASPLAFLERLDPDMPLPATLLMHGTADAVVSPLQTARLHEHLAGRPGTGPLEVRLVEGAGHGGELFGATVPDVVAFLADALGATPPAAE